MERSPSGQWGWGVNVREDLLTDLVATMYKDEARIKQLEASLADCLEFIEHCSYIWTGPIDKHPNTLAATARELLKPKE